MAINFIKNLSQLITGGIGIVDDELVYKDSEGNVKTTATDFEAVEEIPESLDPGQIVFVTETGSLWVGASDDYFPGLEEGTPWPLKGYKQVALTFSTSGTSASLGAVIVNELDINIDVSHGNTGRVDIHDGTVDLGIENLRPVCSPTYARDVVERYTVSQMGNPFGTNYNLTARLFASGSQSPSNVEGTPVPHLFSILVYPPQPE